MEAIRELRAALGLNQIDFSVRVGKSYPMIQRYERQKPPSGKELVPFVYLARECDRLDLARLFKAAIFEEIPEELVKLIRERGPEDDEKAGQEGAVDKRRIRA